MDDKNPPAGGKKPAANEELEKTKKERDNYKSKYLRALADYQNFEKRVRSEEQEMVKGANANLLLKLLPFLDNLEQAEAFIEEEGLKIAKNHFFGILKDIGLEEIAVLGKEYDPHTAEAIDMVPGEKDNFVMEVVRKGYRFNDKILRPAQVKVSKKVNS